MTALHLFAPGRPAAQGSKRHVGNGRMVESCKQLAPWRDRVAFIAHNAMLEARLTPFTGALAVELRFVMPRPISTPKTKTPAAIKKPDLDKLIRACGDALTNVCYRDDAQIVAINACKRLAGIAETPGVHITVREVYA